MNFSVALTTQRQSAIDLFNELRSSAVRRAFVLRLAGRCPCLADFNEVLPSLSPDRVYAGIQVIPIDQVAGSLSRAADFDAGFRPLKAHLRERWVSNFLHMQKGSREAILVHKAGERYYVEDGHHRVSVARATGMAFIEAEVWEYHPRQAAPAPAAAPTRPLDPWLNARRAAEPCPCPESV